MWQEVNRFLKKQNRIAKITLGVSILMLFVLYSLIGIVYRNYSINKQMEDISNNMERLELDNLEQQSKILYYSTDAYQEKILREKLGFQKEGERVYALPRKDPEREKLIKEQQKFQEKEDKKPNIVKWYEFFFAKKKPQNTNNEQI
uniref:Septum formation initiator family protein n=1 Tax=candidate division CPR3 bacterium TaxID=2268181 RepID=A0A7C4M0H6_UNCC3